MDFIKTQICLKQGWENFLARGLHSQVDFA